MNNKEEKKHAVNEMLENISKIAEKLSTKKSKKNVRKFQKAIILTEILTDHLRKLTK